MDAEALWRDPQHWNGGLYWCKEDPRFWVPKRVRWMGWTLNLAHPWAPAALVSAVVLPALVTALASSLKRA